MSLNILSKDILLDAQNESDIIFVQIKRRTEVFRRGIWN